MLNMLSSHRHRFMGANLTQMSPGAHGLLEQQLSCLQPLGLTEDKLKSLLSKGGCLLRIFDASGRGGGGDEEGDSVSPPSSITDCIGKNI